MPKTATYIGRVHDVRTSRESYRFAQVEPLHQSEDGSAWRGLVGDLKQEFPSRGLVFWHDAPESLKAGSYWQFRVFEHPRYDGEGRPERYQIDEPQAPIEVIDLRGRGEDNIRRLLTTEGFTLKVAPIAPELLVWVEDEKWVGPVELVRTAGGWQLGQNENLVRLDCWRPPAQEAFRVDLDGPRILLNPRRDFGEHIGFCNWMTDHHFAKGVLRRLRKLDQKAFEGLKITYAIFDEYLKAMQGAGLVGADLEQELGRRNRIQQLQGTLEHNETLLSEAASVLLETGEVREELEKRKEEEYRRIGAELEQRVEAELADRRAILQGLEDDITRERRELEQLKGAIAAKQEELDERVSNFETALTERISRLAEAPEQAFAELAVLRALLAPNGPSARTSMSPPERDDSDALTRAHRIPDQIELIQVLGENLVAHGASPFLAADLHAAFSSGSVPILTGTNAYEILDAYASTTTAGRVCWIPISGAAFEPQELLGRFDVATRRIVPHPGGLLDVLVEASESNYLYLVVLEGLNRAPVESYLLPLLESFSDVSRGRQPRAIPLAAKSSIDPADPYRAYYRVAWQPNVLLAATPVFGTATLPLLEKIWDYSTLIDCDLYERLPSGGPQMQGSEEKREVYRVDDHQWAEWKRANRQSDTGTLEQISDKIDQFRILDGGSGLPARLYAAARTCEMSSDSALRLVIKANVLPRFGNRSTDVEQLLTSAGLEHDGEIEAILDLSRLLMEQAPTY